MVVNGSLSKTAVNGGAGAQSQVSGLVVAVLTIVTLLFLTGLFESLPEATLAAVVIAAVIELVDVPALVRLYRVWTSRLGTIYGRAARPDFVAAIAAMLGVLIFDTLPGLFIGIADVAGPAALPLVAPERRGAGPHTRRPSLGRHRACGRRSRPRPLSPSCASGGGAVLRQRRPRARHGPRACAQGRRQGGGARRRDRPLRRRHSRGDAAAALAATSTATASACSSPATSGRSATSSADHALTCRR